MTIESVDPDVHRQVSDVLVRYATGIDRRDWDLLSTCFADDLVADYGDIGSWHGPAEITAWMRDVHEPCGYTLHRITNVAVNPIGPGRVGARSYVDALVLGADNLSGAHATGFYDDELVETPDGWRIARRRYTMALLRFVDERTS